MTDAEIELIARAAGLKTALAQFRADVKAAAEEADRLRATVKGTLTPADEPWPPMKVPDSQGRGP
jgi:hypothetical protein